MKVPHHPAPGSQSSECLPFLEHVWEGEAACIYLRLQSSPSPPPPSAMFPKLPVTPAKTPLCFPPFFQQVRLITQETTPFISQSHTYTHQPFHPHHFGFGLVVGEGRVCEWISSAVDHELHGESQRQRDASRFDSPRLGATSPAAHATGHSTIAMAQALKTIVCQLL